MTRRRALLGGLTLAASPAAAGVARMRLQLVPGRPPVAVVARVVGLPDAGRRLEFHATGPGAPAGRITAPSWYGGARLQGAVRLAGRDLALLVVEGNTGTGAFQELLLLAGLDNVGRLRILGIETWSARESGDCALEETLSGRVRSGPEVLVLHYAGRGSATGHCPLRSGSRGPWRSRWTVRLPWTGDGVLPAAASGLRPGGVAHRLDLARGRTAAWLAEAPRDTLTAADLDRLRLYDTFASPPA